LADIHVIIEAHYSAVAPVVNRALVVGSTAAGVDVAASAITQADVDLVGERLDAHHDSAISTAIVAASVAAAVLAKARMDGKLAHVTIPPHCGIELWDVLTIVDSVANQNSNYRARGYTFEYDTRQGIYQHTLDLCAP